MLRVKHRVIVNKPVDEVIRELMKEGWCLAVVRSDGAIFRLDAATLAKVAKIREN